MIFNWLKTKSAFIVHKTEFSFSQPFSRAHFTKLIVYVWKAIRESEVCTGLEKTLPRVFWHCVGLNTQENGCRCSPECRGGGVIQRRSKNNKNDMHSKIKGAVITINFGAVNCLLTPLRGVNGNGAKVRFINPRSPRIIRAVLPQLPRIKGTSQN